MRAFPAAMPRGTALHGARIGETEQAWYARAKAAVIRYDDLAARAEALRPSDVKDALLLEFVGNPADSESGARARNRAAYKAAEAESFAPVAYAVFEPSAAKATVEDLEALNEAFEAEVAEEEALESGLAGPRPRANGFFFREAPMNLALRPVAISGASGPRSSIFSLGVNDVFRAGPRLGQVTDQEWYNEARREVAKYDALVERLRRVAGRQAREDLAARWVGSPSDPGSGLYRRNSVADDIALAESYTPVNYLVFGLERRRGRVRELDDVNDGFEAAVRSAEATWGSAEPQVVERLVYVPGEAAPTSPLVPILVVSAVGLGVLAALGAFGG